jgi:diguanylate cyclase (GGDEF)-like protein
VSAAHRAAIRIHGITAWPIWELPGWLAALVAGIIAIYAAAVCAALALTPIRASDLRLFAILLACGALAVELTRRAGEPGGVDRDVYAIWDLPAAVLLPPLYALLIPIPRMVLTQWRIRRTRLHRRAYTAASVGLAYAAASLAFHAAAPALSGLDVGTGGQAAMWTLLAGACGLLRLAVNDTLVMTAVKGSAPATRLRPLILGPEAIYNSIAELCLGVLVASAAAWSIFILFYALPLVILLQRSLRHAQLVNASRIDSKTGLLNAATWQREAAMEVTRAARKHTPIAVAMLDIDHFKKVNDTYGHLAGDAVLAAIAAAARALLREYDIIGRFGGEEFAILLPHTGIAEATQVTERLRARIPHIAIPGGGPVSPMPSGVTVSIGVAATASVRRDLVDLLATADRALYQAKNAGRDRVHIISDKTDSGPFPVLAARSLPDTIQTIRSPASRLGPSPRLSSALPCQRSSLVSCACRASAAANCPALPTVPIPVGRS